MFNQTILPHRSLYNVNELFKRKYDLTVMIYNTDGTMTVIPTEDLDIGIVPDLFEPEEVIMLPQNGNYLFTRKGQYGVVVQYPVSGKQNQYSVQVIDTLNIGGGNGNNGSGGGAGITIGWD